jgi:predicted ester cyclase
MQGTDTGGIMGMPPNGKKVSYAGVSIFRFANGKVVERWYIGDNLTFMRQLGLL